MDTTLFYAVNHGMQNPFFNVFMPFITRYPNWMPLLLGIFGYLIYRDKKRGALFFLLTLVVLAASDFVCSTILKKAFAVPRPCITLPDVHMLPGWPGCSNSGSFPSSHAANSAAIAAMLGLYDRRFWWLTIPAAFLVSLSRPYLGVHYPSDVVFGALVGAAIAYGAMRISGFAQKKPAAA